MKIFRKIIDGCVGFMQKYLPEPFIFAIILTFVAILVAIPVCHQSITEVVVNWGGGVWNLLGFSMQMALVLVSSQGERSYDIYSRLLEDRIIMLCGEIDDNLASSIVSQLLFLAATDSEKDISIYINSPGGSISAGMAIVDTMDLIKPDVSTICVGMAASMGAFILAHGAKGKRYALPNSEVMIHQPLGGTASSFEYSGDRFRLPT